MSITCKTVLMSVHFSDNRTAEKWRHSIGYLTDSISSGELYCLPDGILSVICKTSDYAYKEKGEAIIKAYCDEEMDINDIIAFLLRIGLVVDKVIHINKSFYQKIKDAFKK